MSAGPPPSLENLVKPDFGSRPIGFLPQCCFLLFFFWGGDLDDRMCWLIWLDEWTPMVCWDLFKPTNQKHVSITVYNNNCCTLSSTTILNDRNIVGIIYSSTRHWRNWEWLWKTNHQTFFFGCREDLPYFFKMGVNPKRHSQRMPRFPKKNKRKERKDKVKKDRKQRRR